MTKNIPTSLKRLNPKTSIKLKCGQATDIGGGATNQDIGDCFEIKDSEGSATVLAVFDGHGRELGELAAQVIIIK